MNFLSCCHKITLLFNCLFFAGFAFAEEQATPAPKISKDWQETNLGTQITVVNVQSVSFGKDTSGKLIIYVILYGKPCQLAVVDGTTLKVAKVLEVSGAEGAYANVCATDGVVWLGSNSNGCLYRYVPGSDKVENMGQPSPETTFIWDMVEGKEGKLYGGTYPKGKVFEYDPKTGRFRDYGTMIPEEDYVRCIAYDPKDGQIYAGIGSHAHLVKLDPVTGDKKDILPEEYKKCHFVYALDIVTGKLIAKLDPEYNALVMDIKSNQVDYILPQVNSTHVSPKSPLSDVFYYSAGEKMFLYNMQTKRHSHIGLVKGSVRNFTIRNDEKDVPHLFAFTTSSRLINVDLKENHVSQDFVELPKQPVIIQSLIKGPDGKIYTSGYLSGGTGIYDPRNGTSKELRGVGQAEGITRLGTSLYFGVYPRARIYGYDTAKPWDSPKGAPKEMFKLDNEEQDRPFAMLAVEEENKLFIGTVPSYGRLGGALSIYDFATSAVVVHRNIIPNQSVTCLAYSKGKVFGGTSISGGLGIQPIEKEAKLFVWDIKKGEKVFEIIPVPERIAITCVQAAPDGTIWGWAEGVLFIFDPREQKVVYAEQKVPVDCKGASHVWRGASMIYGGDDYFYCTYDKKFFKIHIKTKELEILREGVGDIHLLVRDDMGSFYYARTHELFKIRYQELCLDW